MGSCGGISTSLSVPQGSRFDIALEKGGESRQLAYLARLHSIQQNVVGIIWFQVTAVSTQLSDIHDLMCSDTT